MANKHNPYQYKYLVTDSSTGRKRKSMSIDKAAKVSGLDSDDIAYHTEESGRADSDTHSVKPQSYGKPSFAFRG